MIFLNSKNIVIERSYKKLDNKRLSLFLMKILVGFLYRLKNFIIIKIYNVFYLKFLIS